MRPRGRAEPPRGPRGSQGGGFRGRGHSRSRQHSPSGNSAVHGRNHVNGTSPLRSGLVDISVRGWKNSKAADSLDGGIGKLREFLERKASLPNAPPAKITKARPEGDLYIISVRPDLVERILHLNGFSFAGAPLMIEKWTAGLMSGTTGSFSDQGVAAHAQVQNGLAKFPQPNPSQPGGDTKAVLTNILGKRYDSQLKLLNLSALKGDPDLQQLGVFANPATESKFFPVIMKICDEIWDTSAKKAEGVESVIVSNNQLASVLDITTLAATFPSLKNLDLSNNLLSDFEGLKFWRWKFRDLEHLIISSNPIEATPDFQQTILKWYPKLLRLNGNEVRTQDDVRKQQNPIPVLAPYFQDEADIGAKFMTEFFPLFDVNRGAALQNFYDASSTFSVSVNTHAKRVKQEEGQHATWDAYMKKSRNLLKITHLPARRSRLFRGSEIQSAWEQIPLTRHPTLNHHPNEWLVECHPLPGLPDPQNQSPSGVGGLIIMVHGSFEELQPQTGKITDRRSFDRNFVLGPGNGTGGIRVVSDMLVLRGPGGSDAWGLKNDSGAAGAAPNAPATNINLNNSTAPNTNTNNIFASDMTTQAPPPSNPAVATAVAVTADTHPEVPPGSTIGQPAPGKPDVQLQQEILAIELSFKTGMKLEWAAKCLMENGWDPGKALANFQQLLAKPQTIPAEAFLEVKR